MSLFGMERFSAPDAPPPQGGPGRYFAAAWQNLGGLLGANLLCCAGFLPLALGVSLGVVYQNFWLTLLGGALGGALAGLCWTPMFSLSIQAFCGGTRGWLRRWRQAALAAPGRSALAGSLLGMLGGAVLLVGRLAGEGLGLQAAAPALVWAALAADGLLLALETALLSAIFAMERPVPGGKADGPAPRPTLRGRTVALLLEAPGRVLAAAAVLLAWCLGAVALFPVSVPFALAVGFWPAALLAAQLLLKPIGEVFGLPQQFGPLPPERPAPRPAQGGLDARQRAEIFWRRRGPVVIIAAAAVLLLAWGGSQLLAPRPDLEIAVVHAQPLPDGVLKALQNSLAARVGDLNGDGQAAVQVNDYTVVFNGAPQDADRQTAGSTLLVSDLAAQQSAVYLVEDPQGFLARYADQVTPGGARLWADWPALAALDAGSYARLEAMEADLPGQQLLAGLTVLPGRQADPALLQALLGPDGREP